MFRNKEKEKGVSLYLAFMIMSIMLGIALGISTLLIDQFVSLRNIGYSAFAFEAADAGIEKIFYDDRKNIDILAECPSTGPPPPGCKQTLANGAKYVIRVAGPGSHGCPADVTYCARSTGTFQSTQRKIRIAR